MIKRVEFHDTSPRPERLHIPHRNGSPGWAASLLPTTLGRLRHYAGLGIACVINQQSFSTRKEKPNNDDL
jgi:hypothetical protein